MVFLDNFMNSRGKVVTDGQNKQMQVERLSEYEMAQRSDFSLVKVKEIFVETEKGVLLVGKVLEGALVRGFKARVGAKMAVVKEIMARYETRDAVGEGGFIGFLLEGITKYDIKPGTTLRFVRVGSGVVE